jgi:predicted dehydrogenase
MVGEACHFIDLLRFLAGAPIEEWRRMDMAAATATR